MEEGTKETINEELKIALGLPLLTENKLGQRNILLTRNLRVRFGKEVSEYLKQ